MAGMYRDVAPEAYAAGFDYGFTDGKAQGLKYADGYTGAEIRGADEETPASVKYSAYCEGYGDGERARAEALGLDLMEVMFRFRYVSRESKMDDVTDAAWAVRWMASSGVAVFNGEVVRSWGKDSGNFLVAVRTDSGTYPVRNLPAVIAHR